MGWQFHFRNFMPKREWFGVYHAGCGGAPWHDGRPRCWETTIDTNPQGGDSSVYVPSDWVVDFGAWFEVILDGLKLVEDVGLVIASEGEDEEALEDALEDIFDVAKDTVKAVAESKRDELKELVKQTSKSFKKACKSIDVDPDKIKDLARQMNLGNNWAFLAGNSYVKKIHDDSKLVGGWGWSVFQADPDASSVQRIANHAFIQKGHIIQAFEHDTKGQLWKKWD